ncbi:MAG: DUF2520 domain-containing protein [Bacteroidales bacterium]|nr:DUF2520 domain-containing protein [Bacteroidales bacterium]
MGHGGMGAWKRGGVPPSIQEPGTRNQEPGTKNKKHETLKTIRNIVIIGSGNVAWHFTRIFSENGVRVLQVLARNENSAGRLSGDFNVSWISAPGKIDLSADLYILAVQDEAIGDIARQVGLTDQLLVHTSGFAAMDILFGASENIGVIWPLQTLTAGREVAFNKVPVFIEANSPSALAKLRAFAGLVSDNVLATDSLIRRKVHLAAVTASNLTNHLYTLAASVLEKENIPFDVLAPLIAETAAKAAQQHPTKCQTGPAARNDLKVIREHLALLKKDPAFHDIYQLISESIIHHHTKQK